MNTLGLIAISGTDAKTFLQGLLTCDMNTVDNQHYQLGACCNKKGRVIATFRCFQFEDSYYLLLPASNIQPTLAHLKRYLVFSKTTLQDKSEQISTRATLDEKINHETWQWHDIQSVIPNIYPETADLFTPQMINYDQLGGFSLKKGCYLGQEIIARTTYLGKTKKHLYPLTLNTQKKLSGGDKLYDSAGTNVGTIIDALKKGDVWHLLAVLQDATFERGENYTTQLI